MTATDTDGARVGHAPDDLRDARRRLHVIAANVLAAARHRATGRIGLRATPGGFGTPPFEADGVLTVARVAGDHLVLEREGHAATAQISTLGAAARLVLGQDGGDLQWATSLGVHDLPETGPPELDVSVGSASSAWFGDWFELGREVLERLGADEASLEASEPQLWPEHFDEAIEILPDQARASYGFSPGDESHPEPYAYVSIWCADDLGIERGQGLWTATSFPGAILPLSDFVEQQDQVGFLLDWFRERRDALTARQRTVGTP